MDTYWMTRINEAMVIDVPETAVLLIDANLQDPSEILLEMVVRWHGGHDVVYNERERQVDIKK